MDVSYSAVILAGGACSRYGRETMLKDKVGGKSVLSHSLDIFGADEFCTEILVSASAAVKHWIDGDPLTFSLPKMRVLEAGDSRGGSALAAARTAGAEVLVLHDANRPNFTAELVGRLLSTVRPGIGAALVCELNSPVVSLTEIGGRGNGNGGVLGPKADYRIGHLMEHQQPEGLYELQTPQAFLRDDYLKAAKAAGNLEEYADDSSMFIAGGLEVAGIAGRTGNLALISESNLRLLDKLLGGGPKKKDKYTGLGW